MAIVYEDSKKHITIELFKDECANIINDDSTEKIIVKNDDGQLLIKGEFDET